MNPDFFSNEACACGCGNLLPKTITKQNWKYLRGHKQQVHSSIVKHAAPRQKPGTSTNIDAIDTFLTAQLDLVTKELNDFTEQVKELQSKMHILAQKKNKLQTVISAMKEI